MRPTSQAGIASAVAFGSAALAVSMVVVNFAFEAAGSVPDLEGCGFLAGSISSLALIYPLLAAVTAYRAARKLLRRGAGVDVVLQAGAAIGALGAGLYFCVGSLSVMRGPHGDTVSPNVWGLTAVFVLACAWASRIGAALASSDMWPMRLRRTEH